MTATAAVPPIPAFLQHLGSAGGLALPFVAPDAGTNREKVAHTDPAKVAACAKRRRCMLCGEKFAKGEPFAFIGYESAQVGDCFSDPWLHVRCAEYTAEACPFIAGRRTEIKRGPKAERDWLNAKERTFRIVIARRAGAHQDRMGTWHFKGYDWIEERPLREALS